MIGKLKEHSSQSVYICAMSVEEAQTLMRVFSCIGGAPEGPRGVVDKFLNQAYDQGLRPNNSLTLRGDIHFLEEDQDTTRPTRARNRLETDNVFGEFAIDPISRNTRRSRDNNPT